ncbi:tagaturonate reductase [Paraglaciecola aquimarina]|uniref:Tagaturonate reductase n=1 Tax=Paraglaciecola algarum TaxID=3050085 RepID=A0ABS9D9D4_9ALTE|nr:tagaturonate reductase [Paraglaciecola sp. G1-23]MCF2949587.1 tagaturonate reductase [Paraglaciecola sp. G1-23]
MKQLNRQNFPAKSYPTKIMQFGSGNFLRGFIDWQIDYLNRHSSLNAGVSIIRPRPIKKNAGPSMNEQDCLYTTLVRGLNEQGEVVEEVRVIDCVNEEISIYDDYEKYLGLATNPDLKIIFSNTTEAGIEYLPEDKLEDKPAKAFPAKLTQWLFERFVHFDGGADTGVMIIPCELIDYNGEKLKEIVLKYSHQWELGEKFENWLAASNHFCSTLVDRIVPGFPTTEKQALHDKLGYVDDFLVASEYFHFLAIQGPQSLVDLLCLKDTSLNIKVVDDIYPYKQRKVAILNGAHSAMVPLAFMAGINTVGEAMQDSLFETYVEKLIADEIIPTLDLPKQELEDFANDVVKRFKNPYIHHLLLSIALNSMTKVQTRILPQLLKYIAVNGKVPELMSQAIAAEVLLYSGVRNGQTFELADSQKWLELMSSNWKKLNDNAISSQQLVDQVLSAKWHWQQDLTQVPNLSKCVTQALDSFLKIGVRASLLKVIEA